MSIGRLGTLKLLLFHSLFDHLGDVGVRVLLDLVDLLCLLNLFGFGRCNWWLAFHEIGGVVAMKVRLQIRI